MVSARGSLNLFNRSEVYILFSSLISECIYNSVINFIFLLICLFIFPFFPMMNGTGILILTLAYFVQGCQYTGQVFRLDCAVVLDVVDTGNSEDGD